MPDQAPLFVPVIPGQDRGLTLLGQISTGSNELADALAPMRAVLQHMLGIYSTAILVIAGFIVLYLVLLTIVDAAQTGKAFRKINPVWGPLRLVMVIGLLVPLGGMNSGQYIVSFMAKWGSDLASRTWTLATDNLDMVRPMIAKPTPPSALALVRALVLRDVCISYSSKIAAEIAQEEADRQTRAEKATGEPASPLPLPVKVVQLQTPQTNADGSITSPYGWAERPFFCGGVTIYPAQEGRDPLAFFLLKSAHQDALQSLERRTESFAQDYLAILAGTDAQTRQQPQALAERYEEIMRQAMSERFQNAILSEAEAAREQASAAGWIGAPSYLDRILQMNVRIFSTAASLPQVDPPELLLSPPPYPADQRAITTAEYRIYQILQRINASWGEAPLIPPTSAAGLGGLSATLSHAVALARSVGGAGETGHKLRVSRDLLHTNDYDWEAFGSANPLVALASFGAYMTGKSIELLAGAGVLNDVGAVTAPTVSLISFLGIIAFCASTALLLVLPLIPLVRFMIGVAVWLLQVLEALVAVPLVALAHLRSEDDGIAGQSAILCYLMVLQVALRPVLMIFGLLGGLLTLLLMLAVLNRLLATTIPTVLNSGQISSLWFVLMTGLYAILVLGLANACFKLIDWLPERVLTWLSGLLQPAHMTPRAPETHTPSN